MVHINDLINIKTKQLSEDSNRKPINKMAPLLIDLIQLSFTIGYFTIKELDEFTALLKSTRNINRTKEEALTAKDSYQSHTFFYFFSVYELIKEDSKQHNLNIPRDLLQLHNRYVREIKKQSM